MPAFDGAQISARRGRAGWGGAEGRAEGGPVSARLRKGHFQATLDLSRKECVQRARPERQMCVSHIHTHLLGFSAGKGTCPDTAQPDPFVGATVLSQSEEYLNYIFRGDHDIELDRSGSLWPLMTQNHSHPLGRAFGIPVGSHLPGTRCWMPGSQCTHASGLAPGTSRHPAVLPGVCVSWFSETHTWPSGRYFWWGGGDFFFFFSGWTEARHCYWCLSPLQPHRDS